MMTNSLPQDASLGAILHDRALSSTQTRLLLDIGIGAAFAVASWWFHPKIWIVLVSTGLCFVCYGVWALAERELVSQIENMSQFTEYALSAVRVIAALAGLASALVMAFSLIAKMLGTWIS